MNTPPAPITPYFIYSLESLNLRFRGENNCLIIEILGFDKNTPPAPITPYFIYSLESLNLRFQEGSNGDNDWIFGLSKKHTPSPSLEGSNAHKIWNLEFKN